MPILLYGAYGYTGRLIAQEALDQGLSPVLAGRNHEKLEEMGGALGLPTRVASLSASTRLREILDGVTAVLHCAGPFVHTGPPMVEACLDTGTHYLDITGEIDVFEGLLARDPDAREFRGGPGPRCHYARNCGLRSRGGVPGYSEDSDRADGRRGARAA